MSAYTISVAIDGVQTQCAVERGILDDDHTHAVVRRDDGETPRVILGFTTGRDAYVATMAIETAFRSEGYTGARRFKAGPIMGLR